jgi:hypothetical protein
LSVAPGCFSSFNRRAGAIATTHSYLQETRGRGDLFPRFFTETLLMKSFRHLFATAALVFLGLLSAPVVQAQAFSDYVENRVIDALLRNQAFPTITNIYVGLSTAACSDTGFGTEVANSNNYSRVTVAASLANWAGTQGAGITVASDGTGGQTSNNGAINFPTPSGSWGTVTHWFLADSGTHNSGNILICDDLTVSKTINNGDTVSFAIAALTVTVQ